MRHALRLLRRFPFLLVALLGTACGGQLGGNDPTPGPGPTGPDAPASPAAAEGTPRIVATPASPPSGAVAFHLMVSNQSFDVPLADIDITLDGAHVVTGDFAVGSQHTFFTFDFTVAPGPHTLSVTTKRGSATLAKSFELPADERWGVVMFWREKNGPASFSWDVYDDAPGID